MRTLSDSLRPLHLPHFLSHHSLYLPALPTAFHLLLPWCRGLQPRALPLRRWVPRTKRTPPQNRTIKIDVLNDEMTLEADTKLVENALESMKLNGAKRRRFTTCQENWRANSTDWGFRETHVSGVDFVPQLGDEVGVVLLKTELTLLEQWSVSQDTWKNHGVDTCKNTRGWVDTWWRTGDACWRMHDKRQMQRYRCMWFLIGLEICLEGRARQVWSWEEANICCDTCHVCRRLLHCQAEKLSITLWSDERVRVWEFNHITKIGWLMFQYKSTVTAQQQEVLQEEEESKDVWDICKHVICGCRVEWRLVIWSWMLLQVRGILRIHLPNHCRDAKSANGQSMLVRDGCSNNNNKWWRTSWWMHDDEHPDGLTRCSTVSSRQTRIFGKLSAVSAVAAAAELVENEPGRLSRWTLNARGQGVRSKGVKYSNETQSCWVWKRGERVWKWSESEKSLHVTSASTKDLLETWLKKEWVSEDAQRPEGQVEQQSRSFQSNQPIPNPSHDRSGSNPLLEPIERGNPLLKRVEPKHVHLLTARVSTLKWPMTERGNPLSKQTQKMCQMVPKRFLVMKA